MSLNSGHNTTNCHDELIVASTSPTKKFSLPTTSAVQLDKLLERFKTTPCHNEPISASKTPKKQFTLPKTSTIQLDKLLNRFK